jgi:hypothetical protein
VRWVSKLEHSSRLSYRLTTGEAGGYDNPYGLAGKSKTQGAAECSLLEPAGAIRHGCSLFRSHHGAEAHPLRRNHDYVSGCYRTT